MKIATFNINNINRRPANLLAWLAAAKPDVVCLQELKATDAAFPGTTLKSPASTTGRSVACSSAAWAISRSNQATTDDDLYPSKSWAKDALLQPENRAAYRRLLDQGWTDAIRARHPTGPVYTFWDYKRDRWARDAGLRLDQLLLSPVLANRLVDAGVDRDVRGEPNASDHAPARVSLRRPPPAKRSAGKAGAKIL